MLLSGLLWRGAPHALIEHVQAGTLAPTLTNLTTGPARALLKIVASNPKAIEALHG